MKTTIKGYHPVAMMLHWLIALAILLQLGGGYAMSRMASLPDALKFSFFQWHKTIGLVILALTAARIFWRLTNRPPAPAPMKIWERGLSHLVHVLFYALMLIVPLTGWYIVSVSPTHIPTFLFLSPLLEWPHLPFSGGLEPAEQAHMVLAYAFVLLLVLHVVGALKHGFMDREPSFTRIVPSSLERIPACPGTLWPALLIPVLFLAAGVGIGLWEKRSPVSAPSAATSTPATESSTAAVKPDWTVDYAASTLDYEARFSGATVKGAIGKWQAFVAFDPENLETAAARVVIDASSISISDTFIASSLSGDDGLQTSQFPNAEVVFTVFEKTESGFIAHGNMSIRGITLPVTLPFTFEENSDGTARVAGTLSFDRLAYKLGAQNDSKAEWLGATITVHMAVVARRITP